MKTIFTKTITTPFGDQLFHFRLVKFPRQMRYIVTTDEKKDKLLEFHMEKSEKEYWTIMGFAVDDWLLEYETKLSDAIKENERKLSDD